MEIIQLNGISVQDRELQYGFSVSDGLKKYFTDKPFVIEYPENIESVPESVLAVPFVCNVLPIVWIEDAELIVPELDEDFFNCLGEIKKGYVDMYPEVEWKGKISVEKIVKAPDRDVSKKSIALFSGGVDATTTLLRHIDENPLLVTLWGADIAYDNAAGWNTVYSAIQASAVEYGVKNTYIRSSFRKFDNEGALDGKYRQILGKGWWYGAKHGIAILGHMAPLAYLCGAKNIYIASSNWPGDGAVKCASDPRIDNMVRFCGGRVFHDGFELDRQKKVKYIVDYHERHADEKINLHVCWESPTGKNCCRCEKCYRTMLEFWTEGEDPKSYGFEYASDIFDAMYRYIALDCVDMAKKTWTRTKNRLSGNWPQIEKESYAEKIRWVLDYDFMNLENNPCRIRYQKKQRLKHILRQCVNPKAVFRKVFPKLYKMAGMVKHHPMIMNQTDEERETGLRKLYYERTGEVLDFDHAETFNEKIQWYKLYYDHRDLSRIVCKYHFKEYVREKLGEGHTIPLIGAWKNVDDIDWESLPNRFVLKSNAQSNSRYIRFITDKSTVDWSTLKEELKEWLIPYNTLVHSYCRAYYDVTPMIVAEEYFAQLNGQLYDYKFWCFNGEPKFAYVVTDHFQENEQTYPITFYDLNWNYLPINYGEHEHRITAPPNCLKEMLRAAEVLSKKFPFVRVDFFEVDDQWYLSELTFYPTGGFEHLDPLVLKQWGEMFRLPPKNKLGRKYRFDLLS